MFYLKDKNVRCKRAIKQHAKSSFGNIHKYYADDKIKLQIIFEIQ